MKEENVGRQSLERRPEEKPELMGFDMAKGPDETVAWVLKGASRHSKRLWPDDHKEGEGVEWEDGEYPPLGAFCEAFVDSASFDAGASAHWRSGRFHGRCCLPSSERGGLFKDDKAVLFAVPGPLYFRPIQSHRDKVIEASIEIVSQHDEWATKDLKDSLYDLYDAGFLKLPEGE